MLTLVACGDRKPSEGARKSPLETAIARDLTARLAQPVSVTCTFVAGIPAKCEASVSDGTKLPIEVTADNKEWAWRVAGFVIETPPIASYLAATLADLKITQTASCGARFAFIEPGGRLACTLSGGGMAFVLFARDGSTSLELDLDAASAAARGEPVSPERDRELTAISKALERLEGASDGEEEVPADGGVPNP